MNMTVKRAAFAALAAILACAPTTRFAKAQSSDAEAQSSDYSDYDDDADNYVSSLFDQTMSPVQPLEAGLGIPAQRLDFVLAESHQLSNTTASVPARIVSSNDHFDVHADGSSTITSHIEEQVLSAQAIDALAQQSIPYSDSLEDLQIKNAYTLKPDGTRLPVAPGAILTRQKSVPDSFFTDLKEKVILFPNVEPGDTLVYDSVIQSRAQIPGEFDIAFSISREFEIDDETISFTTPKSFPLAFDAYGIAVQKTTEGDSNLYTVRYSNRAPALETPQFLSNLDHGLRVFASSAASYDALMVTYKPLVASKLTVTPNILAEANAITAGITDRREQARKLYEWVSGHIRYISVVLGDGGLVPHDADSILANAYGDCKDHAVLYSTLLKAKGIASDFVLINGSNGYILPQIPELATFNHAIVWLPEFRLYADTTSETTPFGALPPYEYGKSVVHVGGGGPALRHTPLFSQSNSTYASVSNLTLDSTGQLSGRHYATASGAFSGELRSVAKAVGASGLDAVVGGILHARGMGGATGSISFPQTAELTPQYSYSSNYRFNQSVPGDVTFAPPEGLNLVDGYSSAILGPVADTKLITSDALPCFGGNLTDDYSIAFSADRRLVSMPQDGRIETANIDYRSHWSLSGNTVSVHRELHAHFDKALCTGEMLHETRDAIARIQKDYTNRLVFASVHAS